VPEHQSYRSPGGKAPYILDLSTASASVSGRFIPGEIVDGIHWLGGWVDLRAGQNAVAKKYTQPTHPGNGIPDAQLVDSHFSDRTMSK
jgi:hypothetical protein